MSDSKSSDILSDGPVKDILKPGDKQVGLYSGGLILQKQPKINRWCVRNLKSTHAHVTNKSSPVSQVIAFSSI